MADPDATISLTYKQLADRLGSSPDAARIKAKRQGWPLVKGNHPSDATHVLVPRAFLVGSARSPGNGSPLAPPDVPPAAPPDSATVRAMDARIQDLQDQLDRERMRADQAEERADVARREAQAERDQLRGDAAAAHERLGMALTLVGQIQADAERERDRLIAEIEAQRQEAARDRGAAQAERDRLVWDALQARQEAQVAKERADGISDHLTALERTLEAAQDERDRLRAEVDQARRPWWRRWRR